MPLSNERWKEVSPSPYAWEREALDFIRAGLPDCEPYRAWSNFEFIADDGSINEVDLLVFTPQGFFLVEIKSRPGDLAGDAQTWLWTHNGRETAMDNPIFLANRKAKKLKALLSRQKACRDLRFPYVDALIFCSSAELDFRLQGTARVRVCLRDTVAEARRPARPGILAGLRRREADGLGPAQGQFDAPAARAISRAMEQAGIRPSQRARRVGDYRLTQLFLENPLNLFQDWEAEHFQLPASKRFVRLYLAAASSSSTERETLKRAARREYEILDNLRHQNILHIQQYTEHESGPALIFEHDPSAVRLDHFLAQRGAQLSINSKLDMVRQLAEALKFAHDKHAIHGALSPQSVLVFGPNSPVPRLKLYNWQTAFRTASTSTSGLPQITATVHADVFWEDASRSYLAPELVNDPTLHGEHLDVFSLGAIAYHIFSGQPPAGSSFELAEKLRRDRGLKLSSVLNGAGEELQMLVEHSTHPEVTVRLASVDEFLEQLARVEQEVTNPSPEPVANPTEARQGESLEGRFVVKQRFGSGSAAIVFLVEKEGREMVLKLANKPENNPRMLDEYESLAKLGHPSIVRVYEKVIVGGLQGFTMQRAGELTLAQRLSKEGRLSLELLERFGEQLLESINYQKSGEAILIALENGNGANLKEAARLVDSVDDHQLASTASARVDRLRMALRLTRWLALRKSQAKGSFEQMAKEYAEETSFVDWARYTLYQGEAIASLGQAYARLLEAVLGKREELNHQFARALIEWSPSPGAQIIPIEHVLRDVVAPAAILQPVLLVVMDGMSFAVFRELMMDLGKHGWAMTIVEGRPAIRVAIAALPTVTEHSRRALLCGRIDAGVGEAPGFAANTELAEASSRSHPPRLFLKGELMDAAEGGLSKDLRDEIHSPRRRIVGVVVNAVDDLLTKGDQISLPWKLEHLHVLAQLLEAAQTAGRLVVVTSDHGHVLEYQGELRTGGEADRYRSSGGALTPEELEVNGGRVGNFAGGKFIAPWSERIRYTSRKAGYHGGLSLQEVLVPVALFSRQDFNTKGLVPAPATQPAWWTDEGIGTMQSQSPETPVAKLERELPLFAAADQRAQAAARNWIEQLLTSAVYQRQAGLAGRTALSADLLRAILGALQDRGDRILKSALAQRIGQPEFRIPGLIASLRRVMNVDGYAVITFEEASGTVCLNRQLLRTQFELA